MRKRKDLKFDKMHCGNLTTGGQYLTKKEPVSSALNRQIYTTTLTTGLKKVAH